MQGYNLFKEVSGIFILRILISEVFLLRKDPKNSIVLVRRLQCKSLINSKLLNDYSSEHTLLRPIGIITFHV